MSERPGNTGSGRDASLSRRSAVSTSRSLLLRVRANDAIAWARLVKLYAPLVCYWCRAARLSEHDVADVAQEVFKAVATHVGSFQKSDAHGTFRGWLRVVTRNKLNDYHRRRMREPQAIGGSEAYARLAELPNETRADDDAGDPPHVYRYLFGAALELIRAEFEERTWQAFWRVVVDDRPVKEVAKELDMRPGTVRVAKSRVLHRLREELGDL